MHWLSEKLLSSARYFVVEDSCDLSSERLRHPLYVDSILRGQAGGAAQSPSVAKRQASAQPLANHQDALAEIIASATDAIITVDEEQRIVLFNKSAEEMFGCRVEEALGQMLDRFIPAEAHQEPHLRRFGQTAEAGRKMERISTVFGRRADGERFPLEVSISQTEVGGQKFFTAILRDTTGQRWAEEALRESQETLKLFIEHALSPLAMFDREMRYLAVSRRWMDDYGLGDKEISGQSHYDLFPEIPERWRAVHRRGLEGEVVKSDEDCFVRTDGSVQWLRWEVRPWYEAQGEIGGIVIFAENITERKQAEEALHESDARNKAMLKAIPDMMFLQSTDGVFLDYHAHDLGDYLVRPEEFLGKDMREVLPPELASELASCFEETRRTGQPSLLEYSLPMQGETRHFEVRLTGCNGNKILSIVRDITERTRMEEELRRTLDELRQLKDQLQNENVYLREEVELAQHFGQIIGSSGSLKAVMTQVAQVAPTDSTVLITGETGTGKELIAHAIHSLSLRRDRPLVKVNCAALPATLIESELFGHEKGAFTGANTRRIGRFELAQGGTILLDEVGELPLELQAKLLRVLQDNEFERLGSSRTLKVDVRVLAATNRELEEAVRAGKFRADLYYRLSVFPVHLPPLRERPDDIRSLVAFYVQQFSQKLGKQIVGIPTEALEVLEHYAWPGNVRELKNVIERAVILSAGDKLQLAESMRVNRAAEVIPEALREPKAAKPDAARGTRLEEVEREHILSVMEQTYWRVEGEQGAAKILGVTPGTLRFRLKKLGLQRPSSRS